MEDKEFDTMVDELAYRKHLKYSQADLEEKLREQREASYDAYLNCDESPYREDIAEAILNAEIEK